MKKKRHISGCKKILLIVWGTFILLLSGCGHVSARFEKDQKSLYFQNPYPFKFYCESIVLECGPAQDKFDRSFAEDEYSRKQIEKSRAILNAPQIRERLRAYYPEFFTGTKSPDSIPVNFVILADGIDVSYGFITTFTGILSMVTLNLLFPAVSYQYADFTLQMRYRQGQKAETNFKIEEKTAVASLFYELVPYIEDTCWYGDFPAEARYGEIFNVAPPDFLALFPRVILSADKKQLFNLFISQQGGIKLGNGESE